MISAYDNINGKNICKAAECNGEYTYYNIDENSCTGECFPLSSKKIDKNTLFCINECAFIEINDNKLECVSKCSDSVKRYSTKDKICKSKCDNFVKEGTNECIDKCEGKKYIKEDDEFICYINNDNTCPSTHPYYYSGSNLCLSSCNPGDYIDTVTEEENLHLCIKSCLSESYIYDYDESLPDNTYQGDACVSDCSTTNKIYQRSNHHCDIKCDSNPLGDYFHNNDNYICKSNCEDVGLTKKYGNICKEKCDFSDSQKQYEDSLFCLKGCEYTFDNKIYYIEDNYECKESLLDYIIENNKGLSKCENNDNSKYYSNNQCVNNCPKGEKFLDGQEDGKNCLNKCPNNEYKYYSITNDNMFKCLKTCNTYVVSSSANSDNLNLCVEEKCSGIYPYYVIDEIDNNIKKCYRKCPE